MRAFIAVALPAGIRKQIAGLSAELKAVRPDAKVTWVGKESLHITLKFLGAIGESQVKNLKSSLTSALAGLPPFTVRVEGIGAFPKTTFPKVIWVGVSDGEKELALLAQKVEEACAGLGYAKEQRPFSPHLTIGRVKSVEKLAPLIKRLQVAEFRCAESAPVSKVILFRSVLTPQGSLYTPLAEIPFTPG